MKAHKTKFTIHRGSAKMYQDLKRQYWYKGLKREVTDYVSKGLTCQQVKVEHRKPSGLLQPLLIGKWKWDNIAMDFVTALPRNQKGQDTI